MVPVSLFRLSTFAGELHEVISPLTRTSKSDRPNTSKRGMKNAACLKMKPKAVPGRRSTKHRAAAKRAVQGEVKQKTKNPPRPVARKAEQLLLPVLLLTVRLRLKRLPLPGSATLKTRSEPRLRHELPQHELAPHEQQQHRRNA